MASILEGKHPNTLCARAELPPFEPRPSVPLGEGPEIGILKLNGDDGDAQTVTVVVQPVLTERPSFEGSSRRFSLMHGPCVAIAEWGTGAGTCHAEIDIAKGTCFTVAGSSITINGRNDGRVRLVPIINTEFPPIPTPIDPNPGPQTVTAFIAGTGTRPSFGRATRTYYRASLRPNESTMIPIPPFAKSVVIQRTPVLPLGITVKGGLGDEDRDGEYLFAAGIPSPRLDLIDIAEWITVRNAGTTVLAFIQVQFELAL